MRPNQTSYPEQFIFFYIQELFPDATNRYKYKCSNGKTFEVDIYIPSLRVAIEYDGAYWHAKKRDVDERKNSALNSEGIYIIRIREKGLPELSKFQGLVIYIWHSWAGYLSDAFSDKKPLIDVVNTVISVLAERCEDVEIRKKLSDYSLSQEQTDLDCFKIAACILDTRKEDNIVQNCYNFSYWDYNLNSPLDPYNISITDSVEAWFTCAEGKSFLKNTCQLCSVENICYGKSVEDCECSTCIENNICFLFPANENYNNKERCYKCKWVLNRVIEGFKGENNINLEFNPNLGKRFPLLIDTGNVYELLKFRSSTDCDRETAARIDNFIVDPAPGPAGKGEKIAFGDLFFALSSIDDLHVIEEYNKLRPDVLILYNMKSIWYDDEGIDEIINYFRWTMDNFSSDKCIINESDSPEVKSRKNSTREFILVLFTDALLKSYLSDSWTNNQFPRRFYSRFREMITEEYHWLAEDSYIKSTVLKEEYL